MPARLNSPPKPPELPFTELPELLAQTLHACRGELLFTLRILPTASSNTAAASASAILGCASRVDRDAPRLSPSAVPGLATAVSASMGCAGGNDIPGPAAAASSMGTAEETAVETALGLADNVDADVPCPSPRAVVVFHHGFSDHCCRHEPGKAAWLP